MTRRRAIAALVMVALILGALDQLFLRIGIHALLAAPNAGRRADQLAEPPPPPGMTPLRFEVRSPPASIAVWRVDAQVPSAPAATIFVLHGIRDTRISMVGLGRQLAAAGFRVFLIDSRGHGASTGDVLSYGIFEARDLSAMIDQLAAEGQIAGAIGAIGFSYGAATAIEWAGRDRRVAAVVAVASFASVRSIMPGYCARLVPVVGPMVPGFLLDRTLRAAGARGGFDPAEASPLAAIAGARARVLLIHGRADGHIPLANSEAIQRGAPDRVELLVAEGEDHATVMADRAHLLAGRGFEFLRRWTAAP